MAKENFFVNNEKESISNNECKRIKKENGLYNYQKLDGTLVSPNEDFKKAYFFDEGLAIVQRTNELYNYLKLDGTFLSTEDFKNAYSFDEEVAIVIRQNGLYNYLKLDGTLVSPNEDFLYGISLNNEGFLPVTRQNKLENYLKLDGTFLLPVDFTVEKSFKDGVAEITITCKVDKEGNLII